MAILTARELAEHRGSSGKTGEPLVVEVGKLTEARRSTRIRDIPNPKPTNRYMLMHPDATENSGLFDCEVTVGEVKLPMKMGRLETTDRAICDKLVSMGYRWMNEPF